MKVVTIVGSGNMGSALARGLVAVGEDYTINLCDRNQAKLSSFTETPRLRIVAELSKDDFASDALVLCIKPQDLPSLAESLRRKISGSTLVVSILAGTPLVSISQAVQFNGSMVRAMPNIPATIACGATGLAASPQCSPEHRALAEQIFSTVGKAFWVEEPMLDAVTGLSGSGPAYIYMIIDALTEGGVKMGLPHEIAAGLAVQTVAGSAQMVQKSGLHPSVLKDQVTTPGGTTIHAVHELESHGLRSMLISAVETATTHSSKLGRPKS